MTIQGLCAPESGIRISGTYEYFFGAGGPNGVFFISNGPSCTYEADPIAGFPTDLTYTQSGTDETSFSVDVPGISVCDVEGKVFKITGAQCSTCVGEECEVKPPVYCGTGSGSEPCFECAGVLGCGVLAEA